MLRIQYLFPPLLLLVLLMFCGSCIRKKSETVGYPQIDSIQKYAHAQYTIDRNHIRTAIIDKKQLPGGPFIKNSFISAYYSNERNDFLWIGRDEQSIDTLLYWLKQSFRHGIDPSIFPIAEIEENRQRISEIDLREDTINHLYANLEHSLTSAFLNYSCFIHFGCIDPRPILNNIENEERIPGKAIPKNPDGTIKKKVFYDIPIKTFDSEFLHSALCNIGEGLNRFLTSIQPQSSFYIRLQQEYQRIDSLEKIDIPLIPPLGDNLLLKKGDQHVAIPIIAKRLIATGDLPHTDHPDSIYSTLTDNLLEAINTFRYHHYISKNEAIGDHTINALNRPMSFYKEKLRINMERLRWQSAREKGNKYVTVNIPAFMLQAIDNNIDSILEMRICCGTARNRTPLLSSAITYMDLNPYWNVPQSIIRKEIIPSYKRDTTYFTRNRMRIYDRNGKELNPHTINWSNYKGNVPFEVKQDNREGNSLGRLIFRFPNNFAVYLHDTPSRWAFMRTNRAVSHGCVRIEKPLDFSFFLLKEKDELMMDRIRMAIDLPPLSEEGKKHRQKANYEEMKQYRFKESTPVFLDYYTMYLDTDKQLFYCEDIYKYDDLLLKAMEEMLESAKVCNGL